MKTIEPKYDNRNPFDRTKWTRIQVTIDWVESCLVNDETSSADELGEYFIGCKLGKETVRAILAQRDLALRDPFRFKLDIASLDFYDSTDGL
jgi:hypothetical protein